MNNEPTVKSFLLSTAAALAAVGVLSMCCGARRADATVQHECPEGKHYSSATKCCVNDTTTTSTTSTTVETVETTTTTLQTGECQVCEPVLPCADPAPCPPVTCTATCEDGQDGHAAPPTIVQVDRCPAPEVMEVCKVRGNGVTVCARAKRKGEGRTGARKILVPRSIIDQIADRERNYNN